jgi:hypothetical protein
VEGAFEDLDCLSRAQLTRIGDAVDALPEASRITFQEELGELRDVFGPLAKLRANDRFAFPVRRGSG